MSLSLRKYYILLQTDYNRERQTTIKKYSQMLEKFIQSFDKENKNKIHNKKLKVKKVFV